MGALDLIANVFSALRGQLPADLNIEYGPAAQSVLGHSAEDLWRTQPYLRTVISFLARGIAQLPVYSYQKVSDTNRQKIDDDPIALLMKRPNAHMTTYDLFFSLVADKALYDEAIWFVYQDASAPSGWSIEPISPSWVIARGGESAFWLDWIRFQRPGGGQPVQVPMSNLLVFGGWNPGRPRSSSSPIDALKEILAEQVEAQSWRRQLWQRGGRLGGFLTRPLGAKWDPKTRQKFERSWQAKYAGRDGARAGSTPILEDGMTFTRVGYSAHEDDYIEGSKLALATVATVFHVNPTMVGLLDNANFSNVVEFRKMLYGDTLGSTIAEIENRINTFLVPMVTTTPNAYIDLDITEKISGTFEERAAALSTSVGAPWLLRNEARAQQNLPPIDGGDTLVTPLNVLVGGQASPTDSGTQNQSGKSTTADVFARLKQLALDSGDEQLVKSIDEPARKSGQLTSPAELPQPYVDKAAEVFSAFFKRQRASVLSALGAKAAADWWDADRWNSELTDDLYALSVSSSKDAGEASAESLGFTADDYDVARTHAFLKAVAASRAGAVNSTTLERLKSVLDDPESDEDPGDVFDEAEDTRSKSAGSALMSAVIGFAVVEAGKQLIGEDKASKTWNTGANPRADHAAMDGETVGLNEKFSNGADWPGDPVLGAEGVANCNCGVTVSF